MHKTLILTLLTVFLCLVVRPSAAQAQQPTTIDLDRIERATVYLIQTRSFGDDVVTCVGTGTLVDRRGLIVTNAHNTVPNPVCPGTDIIVALTLNPGEPPIPVYRAEVIQSDIGLDLALVRVTRDLDGRVIDPTALSLPFVELADSATVNLDETVTVVGFPSVGGEALDTRRGTITGFLAEPSATTTAWFRIETVDAAIPGAMSGGGVYNAAGRLVAVPTTAPVQTGTEDGTCVRLEDSNSDGLINTNDYCVPSGGFINVLRPSSFVRPLLRGASLGLQVEPFAGGNIEPDITGPPSFSRPFFATSVNDGMPTSVVDDLPAGTSSLYLFFDYDNLTPETVYEVRVTVDGVPAPAFSLSPVRWSGGERGLWYVGSAQQVWPNGLVEFTLLIDGLASVSSRIIIGGSSRTIPSFSSLFFGISEGGNLFGAVYVLPTGNTVTARFNYNNMEPGLNWTFVVYYNYEVRLQESFTWTQESGANGLYEQSITVPGGLLPGRYRVELYIERSEGDPDLAALSDFIIAGARESVFPRVFSGARFVQAETPADAASSAGISSFPTETQQIYALFDWEQIAPGTLWTMRWLVDGQVFYEQTVPWSGAQDGQNFLVRLGGTSGVPDGTYRLELLINTVELETIEAQVGIGQLPIDILARATGVQLNGIITDAETGEGISGVSFILITEDFSVADFVWNLDQVYAIGVTDRNGRFILDRLLQYDTPYSVIVRADGYLPLQQDGVEVTAESENPLEIVIPLIPD